MTHHQIRPSLTQYAARRPRPISSTPEYQIDTMRPALIVPVIAVGIGIALTNFVLVDMTAQLMTWRFDTAMPLVERDGNTLAGLGVLLSFDAVYVLVAVGIVVGIAPLAAGSGLPELRGRVERGRPERCRCGGYSSTQTRRRARANKGRRPPYSGRTQSHEPFLDLPTSVSAYRPVCAPISMQCYY